MKLKEPKEVKEPKELTLDCKPGDFVRWRSYMSEFQGILKAWDNKIAIVITKAGEKAVRCLPGGFHRVRSIKY